ncbi:hypothetical protein [Streptomyces cyaneofuscatus]|uniref:hypothetical protein n=1 Tax=Streptomyces cyaneofuscatus TaxID=66883 RepID=UPI00341AA6F9
MAYAIGERCVDVADGPCVEACSHGAPLVVPVGAVTKQDAVLFGEPLPARGAALGRPGGASSYGLTGVDTQAVAAHCP